ncbi:MAG: histidine phosphatase family protein [Alsobacter sp.]
MKPVLLIRHGQSTFNLHYEETGRDPGHIDARLTELGRRQAAEAAARLAQEHVDLVIASPLTRALQTAEIIFGSRGVPIHVTCKHRERLESTCDVGRSPALLKQDYPHLAFDHLADPWWHHDPDVSGPYATEPAHIFESRVAHFRDWLLEHEAERIAVVGHGTFFHALTGRWMQNCEIVRFTLPA